MNTTFAAPSGSIAFSSSATTATTSFNTTTNTWQTMVPAGYVGRVFLTGLAYPLTGTNITCSGQENWTGTFSGSDAAAGATMNWMVECFPQGTASPWQTAIQVKPIDPNTTTKCNYSNSDAVGSAKNYTNDFDITGSYAPGSTQHFAGVLPGQGVTSIGSPPLVNATNPPTDDVSLRLRLIGQRSGRLHRRGRPAAATSPRFPPR